MSKGYAVYSLMKQPRENVVDETLIRDCIYLAPAASTDEERLRVVGNREEVLVKDKLQTEVATVPLHKVDTLLISYRRIGKIENLSGLGNLTKLCLDNNHIKCIENIDHLTKLKWLDLSFNEITSMEGLEQLTELENLSLFANQVTSVTGIDHLTKLTTLSLGNNLIDNLDETARYLHRIKTLRVLILKGCRIESTPHYRVRLLAFVSTIKFLDGHLVKEQEIAAAREEQRENLLPVEEEDEKKLADAKVKSEETAARAEYERINCPDENKLCDELFALQTDGRSVIDFLRCDLVISVSKEILDHYTNDFNDMAKELADAMKAIRSRRDTDEKSYLVAKTTYNQKNTTASKELIRHYEKEMKRHFPRGIGKLDQEMLSNEEADELRMALRELQSALLEKEADQYDIFEALNNSTLTKWKGDAVDVLLQSSFENFMKLEGDLQLSIRSALDTVYEQRQKREHGGDEYYMTGRQDESLAALLDNREEYQKILAEWFETRRKRLEELELNHLRAEEKLLTERAQDIVQTEQDRHRGRLNEIAEYVDHMANLIESHC